LIILAKSAVERANVVKSGLQGHVDLWFAFEQQIRGVTAAQTVEIGRERGLEVFVENVGEAALAVAEMAGQMGQIELFQEMFLQIR